MGPPSRVGAVAIRGRAITDPQFQFLRNRPVPPAPKSIHGLSKKEAQCPRLKVMSSRQIPDTFYLGF